MKKRAAFSLIELSIVMLIIGIVIAGITQSSRLINEHRLNSARTLTQSSDVNSISDLSLWYEATSSASFNEIEAQDSSKLTTWYDISSNKSLKNNASQADISSPDYRPSYIRNCINKLPCVRFASGTHFEWDGTILTGSDYTIFAVEQRATGATQYYTGGSSAVQNQMLGLGYQDTDTTVYGHYGNTYFYDTVPAFSGKIPRIHTYRFGVATGRDYFLNGSEKTPDSSTTPDPTQPLIAYPGATLGMYNLSYPFNGDVAEFIIFTKSLNTEERRAVESYLSKKWSIELAF